ncbi:MAG: electron transport complex subunit RsxC [Fidelibacterota bacterium]|nr:MAG: electron transport complex subunit RsxC [Candidatus Neomarinimicrobiota bacterium]
MPKIVGAVKTRTFKKGVHPTDYKAFTNAEKIEYPPLPDNVFIPLQQHIGEPGRPLVSPGDEVKTGQCVGRSDKYVSSPVHASVTGKVKAITTLPHPVGARAQMVHIQRTGEDEWDLLPVPEDWRTEPLENLRELVQEAGIVGLGGAAFPTHVKLSPPADKAIDAFILNGCECEPYLTADHRAMVELAEKILTGMGILMRVLGVEKGYIGIETNKPDAIEAMRACCTRIGLDVPVIPLQTKYPQGAEKMLIQAVLDRKVPAGGLPMDVGVIVNNVGTALAVTEAVTEGKSLVQRIVTVTGNGINTPKNVMARIGSPFSHLVDCCDGLKEETSQVFMGGPMMGIAQFDLAVPVIKATSGIICTTDSISEKGKTLPCIRCGSCISACSMNLLPTRLARLTEMKQLEAAGELGIDHCIECGSCAFVCPSQIPLVQWIRVGKYRLSQLN